MNFSRNFKIGSIFAVMLSLLVPIIFSDNGWMELNRKKREKDRLVQQNALLVQKNYQTLRIIERLKHDPVYVEHIARKEQNMVGTHQIIFKISNPKQAKLAARQTSAKKPGKDPLHE